jgi:hypothetical protein
MSSLILWLAFSFSFCLLVDLIEVCFFGAGSVG